MRNVSRCEESESTFKQLSAARDKGSAYLTKDRKGSGLLLEKGLSFNFSLFSLHKISRLLIDTRSGGDCLREGNRNLRHSYEG